MGHFVEFGLGVAGEVGEVDDLSALFAELVGDVEPLDGRRGESEADGRDAELDETGEAP